MEITIDQALQQGVAAHKEGNLQDAERLYRAILKSQPKHPDANHNLGVLAIALNNVEAALPFFRAAIEANSMLEQFWLSYIDALIKAKQLDSAKQTIKQAKKHGVDENKLDLYNDMLTFFAQTQENKSASQSNNQRFTKKRNKLAKSNPRKPSRKKDQKAETPSEQLLKNLLAHYQNGEYDSAEKLALSITRMFSRNQFGWKVLGAVYRQTGRTTESLAPMRKCTKLAPDDPEAHNNLGVTLQDLRKLEEAEASYIKAITLKTDYAEAHFNLGNTLKELDRLHEAEKSLRQAIALKPNFAEAHFNLGNTLKARGRLVEAEADFQKAIALKPDYVEAHVNLGITRNELGQLEEAERDYNQAIKLNPSLALAHYNLGNNLRGQGRLDEAENSYKRALALQSDFTSAQSNILFLIASMRFDANRYRKEAKVFAGIVTEHISSPYKKWSCTKNSESIRIGFVSGDFKEHPVGIFLEGLLGQLQSSAIELYAYPTNDPADRLTERLRTLFDSWTPLIHKSDRDAAETIHKDGVHILVDLSGHTEGNRLTVFGWKPAPIQISWLGYFASTGLPEIDYVLGDPFVTPDSEAHHFVEEIWRLPESYLCFTPPGQDMPVRPLPALQNGYVTFGCFNKLLKMTDEVVSVRAKILHAVPNSKLYLKDYQLGYQSVRESVIARFAAQGIAENRLLLEGKSRREEYLACYHRVDIALSPFPYGGGTTSAEGLWMGVPVITKKGDHFLSHLGESIAHNSHLSDWIAVDNNDYIEKAILYSSDLSSLNQLRQGLREKLLHAPLFDSARFACNFERALFDMRESIEH